MKIFSLQFFNWLKWQINLIASHGTEKKTQNWQINHQNLLVSNAFFYSSFVFDIDNGCECRVMARSVQVARKWWYKKTPNIRRIKMLVAKMNFYYTQPLLGYFRGDFSCAKFFARWHGIWLPWYLVEIKQIFGIRHKRDAHSANCEENK